jgi:hypothetical protein
MDETESIRKAFEELIGKPVGDRFTLIPPFLRGLRAEHHRRPARLHRLPVHVHRPRNHRHRGRGHDRQQSQPGHGRSPR